MANYEEEIKIIQAYERGEEVEWRRKNSDMNFIILNYKPHDFNFEHFEYRIKKKRWRAKKDNRYYSINPFMEIYSCTDIYGNCDYKRFKTGNYFRTPKEAEKASELVKETLIKFHKENEKK